MSLFKKNIVSQYNILGYKNDHLYLHCSRYEQVAAPFNGNLDAQGNLVAGNKTLSFKNVKLFNNEKVKVKAGDKIGTPIVGRYDGQLIANFGIALTEGGKNLNVLKYLQRKDKETSKKKVVAKEEEIVVSSKEAEAVIDYEEINQMA